MVAKQHVVSVIATVFNESSNVAGWLTALLDQSRAPDEIVIVDGGSADGTIEIIDGIRRKSEIPIWLIERPGVNISRGRNIAIEQAIGDLIAVTDAGTRADADWLARLIEPLESGSAEVASGFFTPRLTCAWDRALAASTLPDLHEVDPDGFLPSSRSMAFCRTWFDAGIRYPEWLDYCEDLVWDMAMERAGATFAFVPDATVTFAVRPNPRQFAFQYQRYARGDGKAGLFPKRHAARYVTYTALLFVLRRRQLPEIAVATLLGSAYVGRPLRRLWKRDLKVGAPRHETLVAMPLVIALRALGDVAKMIGYPAGLVWRWRNYGSIGWRTAWQRISPAGDLFRPGELTIGSPPLASSRVVEFPGGLH